MNSSPAVRPPRLAESHRTHRQRWRLFGVWHALMIAYFVWRLGYTMNPDDWVFSWLFFICEFTCYLGTIPLLVHLSFGRAEKERAPIRGVPTVDVLIATMNEDVALIRQTVIAARDMRVDHATWVCDDGQREAVRQLADELGVGYITRAERRAAKAGNLNHALEHVRGEFVVVVDADHVLHEAFLERLLGHFEDETIGLVQTPQYYYNHNSFAYAQVGADARLWHENFPFFHDCQPAAERMGTAMCCGTGCIVRRTALDRIGGFAERTITEDAHTSLRLHGAGFRTIYVNEILGQMLTPYTLSSWLTQRLRWAKGNLQIVRFDNPLRLRGLTLWQRFEHLKTLGGWLLAWPRLYLALIPVAFALFGVGVMRLQGPLFVLCLARFMVELAVPSLISGFNQRPLMTERFSMLAIPVGIWATPALVQKELKFVVTAKGRERPTKRGDGLTRFTIGTLAVIAGLNIAAAASLLTRAVERLAGDADLGGDAMWILSMVVVAGYALYTATMASAPLWWAWRHRGVSELPLYPVALRASVFDHAERGVGETIVERMNDQWLEIKAPPDTTSIASIEIRPEAGVPFSVRIAGPVLQLGPDADGTRLRVEVDPSDIPGRDALSRHFHRDVVPSHLLQTLEGRHRLPEPVAA